MVKEEQRLNFFTKKGDVASLSACGFEVGPVYAVLNTSDMYCLVTFSKLSTVVEPMPRFMGRWMENPRPPKENGRSIRPSGRTPSTLLMAMRPAKINGKQLFHRIAALEVSYSYFQVFNNLETHLIRAKKKI